MKTPAIICLCTALAGMTSAFGQPAAGTTYFTGNVGTLAGPANNWQSGTVKGYTFSLLTLKKATISNTANAVELTSSPSSNGYWVEAKIASSDGSPFQLENFDFQVNDPSFEGMTVTVQAYSGTTAGATYTTSYTIGATNTTYNINLSGQSGFSDITSIAFNVSNPEQAIGTLSILDITIVPVVLPVVWTAPLTAVISGGHPLIGWSVSGDVDNRMFQVQRGSDGVNFTDIATLAPTDDHTYNYTDLSAANGINYYRVRQVDFDGEYTYSNIAVVTLATTSMSVFPNPVTDQVTVQNVQNGDVLRLMNTAGQVLMSRQCSGNLTISLKSFPAGMYFIRSEKANMTFTIIRE